MVPRCRNIIATIVAASKFHTFLSHNSADKPAVEEIARRLEKNRIDCWLDKWNLVPGNPWQEAIEKALDDCSSCCVFIGPSGLGPWQNAEMRAAIDRRISKGDFRVIPVLLPGATRGERSQLPAFLTQTTWVEFRDTLDDEDAFHRLECGIQGIAPGPSPGEAIFEGVCPYRGLQVFDVEHAPFFFGREALTEWLVNALRAEPEQRQNRFLAVIGASGSGKSSLVRAGLIPALKDEELEGSADWPVVMLKPGSNPLESLAVALAETPTEIAALVKQFENQSDPLHLTSRFRLRDRPETQRVVVFVDQFEEIFTLCEQDALRRAFIDNLYDAAHEPLGQTIVLLTMRADFYGKCAAYPELAAALSDHQVLVGSMTERELRDAIVKPAQLAGREVEPGLVELLVKEVQDQSGALPLLQYALTEMWERGGRRLTVDDYRAIGKLEGALEQRANGLYDALSRDEQAVCQQIFMRLSQPGEGTEDTKRRAERQELGETTTVDDVLQKLTKARLVTMEGESRAAQQFVEVSHEALIRSWSKLRSWIEENREELRIQHALSESAGEWNKNDRDPSYLYGGSRLSMAQEWATTSDAPLSELEREFLEASVGVRDREIEKEQERQNAELTAGGGQEIKATHAGVCAPFGALHAGRDWARLFCFVTTKRRARADPGGQFQLSPGLRRESDQCHPRRIAPGGVALHVVRCRSGLHSRTKSTGLHGPSI